jgi:hypothetical protein
VEGAWGPWVKVSGGAGMPLPNYQELTRKVELKLSALERMF